MQRVRRRCVGTELRRPRDPGWTVDLVETRTNGRLRGTMRMNLRFVSEKQFNRINNLDIASTSTKHATHSVENLLSRELALLARNLDSCHQHSRRAYPALHRPCGNEGSLKRPKAKVVLHAFNGL